MLQQSKRLVLDPLAMCPQLLVAFLGWWWWQWWWLSVPHSKLGLSLFSFPETSPSVCVETTKSVKSQIFALWKQDHLLTFRKTPINVNVPVPTRIMRNHLVFLLLPGRLARTAGFVYLFPRFFLRLCVQIEMQIKKPDGRCICP